MNTCYMHQFVFNGMYAEISYKMYFVLHGCLNLRIIFLLVSNLPHSKSLGWGTHYISPFSNILHKFHDKKLSTSLILLKKKKKK